LLPRLAPTTTLLSHAGMLNSPLLIISNCPLLLQGCLFSIYSPRQLKEHCTRQYLIISAPLTSTQNPKPYKLQELYQTYSKNLLHKINPLHTHSLSQPIQVDKICHFFYSILSLFLLKNYVINYTPRPILNTQYQHRSFLFKVSVPAPIK
jgi:hypothetical protein